MGHHVLTREALLERVWSRPVRTVARELGVSDTGLLKACRRAGVPTPPRGFWTRVRHHGPAPDRPELAPRPDLKPWVVIAPARRSGTGRLADEGTNDPGVSPAPVRPLPSPGPLALDLGLDPGWHAMVRAGHRQG